MSPSGSEGSRSRGVRRGFTLVEVLVALVVATVLGTAAIRFYKDSYRTFSLQEQLTERDQNAHFLVSRFSDLLQQSGSVLPETGWTVLSVGSGTLKLGINPRGAEQFNGASLPSGNFIPVGDATRFANSPNVLLNTRHVLVDFIDPAAETVKLTLDEAYNSGGFVNGVKDNAAGMDSLCVTSPVALSVGDRIFGYREDHYLLSGGNLLIRPDGDAAREMVLAENVDSLGFTFLDEAGVSTTSWKTMRSASFAVRARTSRRDPHYPGTGYRTITLPMNVILRNRI